MGRIQTIHLSIILLMASSFFVAKALEVFFTYLLLEEGEEGMIQLLSFQVSVSGTQWVVPLLLLSFVSLYGSLTLVKK